MSKHIKVTLIVVAVVAVLLTIHFTVGPKLIDALIKMHTGG